jgi:rubrerythrin
MKEEIREILHRAIEIEVFGTYYYNKISNGLEDREGKALFKNLANAEEEHEETLNQMLDKYGGEAITTEIDNVIASILMEGGIENIFKDLMKKDKLEKVDAIEALKLGIEVEARSIAFYKNNAKKSPKTDLEALFTKLSNWEKEHLDLLKENHRMLKDEGSWYGYVPILEG